ncbi:MAG: T9SS type A sorting domain-containing protein, partial [Candidatus Marinimicrobia bacterium]|nr:T9SS type A sorting domain-containing protein [Candidatus Neomarinimicrobiota bacterium]
NKYIEIYNPTGTTVDLSNYQIWKITNGGSWPEYTLNLSGNLADDDVYIIYHTSSNIDPIISSAGDVAWSQASWTGDDAIALVKNGSIIDVIGEDGPDPGNGWDVAGVADGTTNHTLIRKSSITFGNSDWVSSAGTSADDSEWIVKDDLDWTNIGCHNTECASTGPALSGLTASPAFLTNETEIELSVSITSEVGTVDESSVKVKFGTNDQLVNEAQLFLDAGNTYVGTIPAQQGNTKFQMRVSAKNSEGDEGQSDLVERLIASSTPNQISDLYSNQTSDQLVTIKGIITIGGSGLLYPTQTKAYLQDASGRGLQLFDYNIIEGLDRGDEIEVVGYAGYYQTTYQVKDFVFREISSGNDLPIPIEVTASQANSSNYEGTLIAITGNITAISPVSTNGNNYTIDDLTAVMIWNSTGIDVSALTVGYRGKFVGVGSQYFENYQLLVGYNSDISTVVGIDLDDIVVNDFSLRAAYPNPFNPVTNLSFVLNTPSNISLKIYDINGKLVEAIDSKLYQPGLNNIQWNAASLSSGMYFVHLLNGSKQLTQKVMLLK